MERKFSLEKRPEGTARLTGKSGLEPWYRQYTYQEEPINDQRPLHGDPRDEQDNDFSDDDSDHGYGHPGVSLGPVPDFYASTSFASDQGTLAGVKGKKTDAGKWAIGMMKDTGEYGNLQSYWEGLRKGKKSTESEKQALTTFSNLKKTYQTVKTIAKNPHRVGHARWR